MELESEHRDDLRRDEKPQQMAENLPDLFTLHEQIVLRDPINISEVFGKEPDQTVAFEVALAALIATAVLTVSISSSLLEAGGTIAALLLLGITLVRKMILDNAFIDTDQMMRKTTGWMQYLIMFSAIYMAVFVAESIVAVVSGDVLLVLAIGLFVSAYALLLLYEFLFGDLFFWVAVKFHNRAVKDRRSYFNHGLLESARFLLQVSPKAFNDEHPAVRKIQYQGVSRQVQGSKEFTMSVVLGVTLGLLVVGALISVPVMYWVTGSTLLYTAILTVLLGLSALPLQGLFQFVLSRYGNASFEEVSGLRDDVLPMLVILAVALVYEVERTGLLFG
ncbi:hypothetical protein HT576_08870 [Haloterrigena sp. SYSU A121-1]|uniref:Uncharacterized protein n=1 Tax=Haloterrigena gelatinilytica TaxID=2741724 RepID=A0A8J8GMQ7_9EURY|nr:hypothetical protein [Haloterrigena gelatinilytica]NUB91132.1 hypothetical protein [Haloterrigena gelatinilytica]